MNSVNYYIDARNIINQDFLETVRELVVCAICHGIIVEPKQCENCENSFCNRCIVKHLENDTTCPHNCEILKPKEATRAVKNLLDKLNIRCSYCHDNTSYTYDQYLKHLRTCSNVKIKCLSCGSMVPEKCIKDNQVIIELREKIAKLTSENEKLQIENNELNINLLLINVLFFYSIFYSFFCLGFEISHGL